MSSDKLKEKVLGVLQEIRPQIQAHGGDFKLVKTEKGKVVIKILGACLGCPMAEETFGAGLKELLKSQIPEVKEVEFQE